MIDQILTNPLAQPILFALICGAAAYVISRATPRVCRLLALVASAGVLWLGIFIARYSSGLALDAVWIELGGGLTLSINLAPSILGMVVVIGSAVFCLLVTVYSFAAMAGSRWEGKFYAYVIWSLAGACIVGLANNLLVLLIGWELVTLMLFLLINLGRGDAKAGGAKTYGVLGFADACLLLALALLATLEGGSANWVFPTDPMSVADLGVTGYAVYVLILIAALAKAGAVPLHTWIPSAAQDSPTPVMALLPAAMDKLLGIYLLALLTLRMFQPDAALQTLLMVVGAVTILAAVLTAMVQHNLKKLLSFCAVSQVGYIVLGIGTGTTIGVLGGLFHMVNHAIYKSNLFLMSGTVGKAAGSDEIEEMGGLARLLPVTFVCGAVSAAAISGVPPFNGFVSKLMLYQAMLDLPNRPLAVALLVVAVFGSALTLATFVKAFYSAFLSPAPKPVKIARDRVRENFWRAAPMVVLALGCVVLGLWPQLVVNGVLVPAIADVQTTGHGIGAAAATVDGVDTGYLGLWQPTHAAGLLLLGIVLGLMLVWLAHQKLRIVRPFLCGELPAAGDDRFRVPGTHFYETVEKLPLFGPLLKHGQQGAFDLYHWFGKYGHGLVERLRAQHTGLISLYVAWCIIGLVATLVYILLAVGT